ncbi:flagellin N-terminal helical domain-containing protein [Paenirhodobacter hankyongi]|uniref:Flagellin n=1 Tax=Paenirhodobacter hankyongi TaxID=2294033 RepID=A0A421BLV2_9RHOB|nr:flagellin [Sinirhodobacter hankyongi]RLL64024.1 flagellin [Sinirhodobacter hankyongi]
MSSILTNTSAMVALQTLKGINSNLSKTQGEISTGKSVGTAKDNAAVWAISKVMEADVKGFQGISDSLSLGESTVAVARQASETVTDLLTKMQAKIVSAQDENQDRSKIQTDVDALKAQIASVVSSAQFNGLNLIDGSKASTNILSSLDRTLGGDVSAAYISVAGVDFSAGSYTARSVFATGSGASGALSTAGADTTAFSLGATTGAGAIVVDGTVAGLAAGDSISVNIGNQSATYTVTEDDLRAGVDKSESIAFGLKNAIDALGISGLTVTYDDTTTTGTLNLSNTSANALTVTGQYKNADSGDLSLLATIDVTDDSTLAAQLTNIEKMIDSATTAAANFGSVESRLETQADFVSKLTDAMKTGIGALVDADMEEASARLQALQTQQQLGIQSLSIANQQPQNILSLFK